jgi:hypothetical protein
VLGWIFAIREVGRSLVTVERPVADGTVRLQTRLRRPERAEGQEGSPRSRDPCRAVQLWLLTRVAWLALLLLVLLFPRAAAGQDTADTSLGDTDWALPGIARVGVAATRKPRLAGAATGGYGYTEALGPQDGSNLRLGGTLSLAGAPTRWLELALRLDGRYNSHPDDDRGSDRNMIGDPRFSVRLGHQVADAFHFGVEGIVWLPGKDAPSIDFGATTVDARGLAAWRPKDSGFTLALLGGYRFDQSASAGQDPRTLRIGDRISLGLSDFDALLLGLGLAQRVGSIELLGEFSTDLMMGSGAPPASQSPMRATAGVRYHVTPELQLQALGDLTLSGRPGVDPDDPFVPIEPRFSALLGLRYLVDFGEKPAAAPPPPPPPPPKPKPKPKPAPPPPPPEPPTGKISGVVTDEAGKPIDNAFVTVLAGDTEENLDSGTDGRFEVQRVAVGEATIKVEVEGFETVEKKVQVSKDKTESVAFTLVPALPAGQLRGLVRSFSGKPLVATILIVETGEEATTGPDGRFEIDVPPGRYTIAVRAEGHLGQRRSVRVENRGVTILNADLKGSKWR